MFSMAEKRSIAEKIQQVIKETSHPELPDGEVEFHIHIKGAESWSWADIKNNGSVNNPGMNPFNEMQGQKQR